MLKFESIPSALNSSVSSIRHPGRPFGAEIPVLAGLYPFTREGTDYRESEVALATKVDQIRQQLDQGILVILYSEQDGSVTIANKDRLAPGFETAG